MGFHCNYFAINDFNFIHFSNASKIQVKHYVRNTKGANKGCRQDALLLHFASLLPTKENNNLHVQNIKPIRLDPGADILQWIPFNELTSRIEWQKHTCSYKYLTQARIKPSWSKVKEATGRFSQLTINCSLINALLKNIIVIKKFTGGRQLSFLLSLLTFITSKKYFFENKANYIPFGTEKKFITSIKMTY